MCVCARDLRTKHKEQVEIGREREREREETNEMVVFVGDVVKKVVFFIFLEKAKKKTVITKQRAPAPQIRGRLNKKKPGSHVAFPFLWLGYPLI